MPAGYFLPFCLLPLFLFGDFVCPRGVGCPFGLIGILVLLFHQILPLRWIRVRAQNKVVTNCSCEQRHAQGGH